MLYGLMPVKNEAERWLHLTLFDLNAIEIPILVCDDQSTDSSVAIAEGYSNVTVVTRPDDVPSFLEHESQFRQWCWDSLPCKEGDWVLALDADEFLVSTGEENTEGYWLRTYIKVMENVEPYYGCTPLISFPVAEVWDFDENGDALVRTDGWWGQGEQVRMMKWAPGLTYKNARMGSHAVPGGSAGVFNPGDYPRRLQILHYGYVWDKDKQAKYERYKAHPEGHNPIHIESILARPTLEPWTDQTPARTWRV